MITGLWSTPVGERFSYDGAHYQVADSPALPKPVQDGGVPIIVGGGGPKRTPALAARFAAEYNSPFAPVERFVEQRERVVAACEAIDRDPATMRVLGRGRGVRRCGRGRVRPAGRGDRSRARRAAAPTAWPARPTRRAATLQRWFDAGAERLYLQVLDLADLDHLDAIAALVRWLSAGPRGSRRRHSWANVATCVPSAAKTWPIARPAPADVGVARHVVEVPVVGTQRGDGTTSCGRGWR